MVGVGCKRCPGYVAALVSLMRRSAICSHECSAGHLYDRGGLSVCLKAQRSRASNLAGRFRALAIIRACSSSHAASTARCLSDAASRPASTAASPRSRAASCSDWAAPARANAAAVGSPVPCIAHSDSDDPPRFRHSSSAGTSPSRRRRTSRATSSNRLPRKRAASRCRPAARAASDRSPRPDLRRAGSRRRTARAIQPRPQAAGC